MGLKHKVTDPNQDTDPKIITLLFRNVRSELRTEPESPQKKLSTDWPDLCWCAGPAEANGSW